MNNYYRWVVLFAISLICFLINVDYTAVNLALIPMARELGTNLNTIQFVLSGYALAWAFFVIPAGSFSDGFRKKNVCITGLSLFVLASLLAGLATSASFLIAARVLQGIAGAIYIPSLYALIYINFPENERGRAIGILSLGVGLGMAMGPFIGGVILSYLDWRSIFFVNIPIGIIAGYILYREKDSEQPLKRPLRLIPTIPLTLFSNKAYVGTCFGILLEQYSFSSIVVLTGLFLQKVMHYSPLKSSVLYLTLTVIFGVIAALGGPWIDRIGLRKPTLIGMSIMGIGSLLFIFFSPATPEWLISSLFILLGGGMGLAFSALNTGVTKTTPPAFIGIGSSVFVMSALLGNVIGVIMSTLIYQASSLSKLMQVVDSFKITINSIQLQQLINYIKNVGSQTYDLSAFNSNLQSALSNEALNALNHGIGQAMLANVIVCLVCVMVCRQLLKPAKQTKQPSVVNTESLEKA